MNKMKQSVLHTKVYAVRHGETLWNLCGKQQGHADSPLSERGIAQAEALAQGLRGRNISAIYSSDLGRAVQTAEIIATRLALDVQTDPRLRERHLGALQEISKTEFAQSHPEESRMYNSGDPDYIIPGGESARQRYERCVSCIQELAVRRHGQNILIVAHGGTLSSLFYRTLRLPLETPRRFMVPNAALNCVDISSRGDWMLELWGDVSHLCS
jgi:probable phosphoglycerate mutase